MLEKYGSKSTVSIVEASKVSGLGQHFIRTAVKKGSLPAIIVGACNARIRPEAFENWLKDIEKGGEK